MGRLRDSIVAMTAALPPDLSAACDVVAARLPPTPTWSYPALDAATGGRFAVKREDVQPVGAYKIRGAHVLVASLDDAQRRAGLVAYSTGNLAQSLALACRGAGVDCLVVAPEDVNPHKAAAVRAHGARLVLHGAGMAEAGAHAARLADERGARLVHPDDPALVAGAGSLYVELLRARPDLAAVVVPVGSGSGAAAACRVTEALAPGCRVVAVQSAAAPAGHDSWRAGRRVERPIATAAEGLATGRGFDHAQEVLRGRLHDFVLVEDDDLRTAQRLLLHHTHALGELAGAASLAGALACRDRWGADWAGGEVGVVLSGANAGPEELAGLLG